MRDLYKNFGWSIKARRRRRMRFTPVVALEALECRALLAGNVMVSIQEGDLLVAGDEQGNSLVIGNSGESNQNLIITGTDGTTINGQAFVELTAEELATITDDFKIVLGSGDDSLTVDIIISNQIVIFDDVRISMGSGNDTVRLDINPNTSADMIADDVRIQLGQGDDSLQIEDLSIGGSVLIRGGNGNDSFRFGDNDEIFNIGGTLNLGTGAGNDDVEFVPTLPETRSRFVNGNLRVTTGVGDDNIVLAEIDVASKVVISTGRGRDAVQLLGMAVQDRVSISTGVGSDLVYLLGMSELGNTFDDRVAIRTGTQDDSVLFENSTFNADLIVAGGRGDDAANTGDLSSVFASTPTVRSIEETDVDTQKLMLEVSNDNYRTFTNGPLLVDPEQGVLANDRPPRFGRARVNDLNEFSTVQGGTIDFAVDGSFIYAPPADFVGTDSVQVNVGNILFIPNSSIVEVITIEVERDPLAVRLGALGDSLTDEYEFEGNRNYASNWIELLNSEFGVDVGTSGNRSAPRRSGFEYNWALSGATSDSLIEDGQHTGLAAQAMSGDVSHAFLLIGQNDFRDIVLDVVLGNFSAAEETAFVNTVVANITTAVDTLLATDVALVLSNLIDYSVAPLIRDNVPLILRNQLTNVVVRVNDELADLAEDRQIPLLDSFAFSKSIFGTNSNPNETVTLCGVEFDNSEGDGTATDLNLFTEDGIHPHTAAQAVIANAIVEAFNLGHGTNLPQFSECDIVSLVGATGTGENSLDIDYSEFVTLPNVL